MTELEAILATIGAGVLFFILFAIMYFFSENLEKFPPLYAFYERVKENMGNIMRDRPYIERSYRRKRKRRR